MHGIFERLWLVVVRRECVGLRKFAEWGLRRKVDPGPPAVDRDLVVAALGAGSGGDPVSQRRDHQTIRAGPVAQLVRMLGDPGERRLYAILGRDQALVLDRGVGDRVQDSVVESRIAVWVDLGEPAQHAAVDVRRVEARRIREDAVK
jgi:hypothetical protein